MNGINIHTHIDTHKTVKAKWDLAEEVNDGGSEKAVLRDVEQQIIDEERKRTKSKSLKTKIKNVRKTKLPGIRLSAVGRGIRNFGVRIRATDRLSGLGFNPDHFKIFQKHFMRLLRIANMMQGFYIALIISHWCWYAPSTWESFMELTPLVIIYIFITPLIVRRYAMVMSLGKPNPRAMSLTIEYMDHNDQALHQVAELILDSKDENESIEDVFNDWDINGDKELSFKELEEAMSACNMHMQKERLKAMWNKIDIDSSGSISAAEFRRAIAPYVDQVMKERADLIEAGFIPRRSSFATRSSFSQASSNRYNSPGSSMDSSV
jgi:Ca2+-binding EF-hand superfamily protein